MPGFFDEGQVLAGKYRVERVLGQGGMGVVLAAYHLQLGKQVALKFLLPSALTVEEALARFVREARVVAKLQSEHVARVMDVGTLESGAPYIVMERLHGTDLHQRLSSQGPLDVHAAIDYVLQACEALAEAHALGIVHRDIKTANLFLTQRADGSALVKVLDFGISKAPFEEPGNDATVTATNAVMGSPAYMSPEQLRSAKDVDARADIWSLGVVLYELLTAGFPYVAATYVDLLTTILAQPPVPMRSRRPELPLELERVVLRCLEKDRQRRFAHVAELAQALAAFGPAGAKASAERSGRIVQAAARPVSEVASAPEPTLIISPSEPAVWEQGARAPRASEAPAVRPLSRGARAGLAVAAAAVIAVGAGAWAARRALSAAASGSPGMAASRSAAATGALEPNVPEATSRSSATAPEQVAAGAGPSSSPELQPAPSTGAAGAAGSASLATDASAHAKLDRAAPSALAPRRGPASMPPKPAASPTTDVFSKRKW